MRKLFSIRDVKISVFNVPFFAESEISATRMMHMATRDENTQLHQFPSDFQLFQLGEYDEVTGKLVPVEPPRFIIDAAVCRAIDEKEAALKDGTPEPGLS